MVKRSISTAKAVDDIIHGSQRAHERAMRAEVALYVADMSAELAKMARASDLALLAYFLEMAVAEGRAHLDREDDDTQALK